MNIFEWITCRIGKFCKFKIKFTITKCVLPCPASEPSVTLWWKTINRNFCNCMFCVFMSILFDFVSYFIFLFVIEISRCLWYLYFYIWAFHSNYDLCSSTCQHCQKKIINVIAVHLTLVEWEGQCTHCNVIRHNKTIKILVSLFKSDLRRSSVFQFLSSPSLFSVEIEIRVGQTSSNLIEIRCSRI